MLDLDLEACLLWNLLLLVLRSGTSASCFWGLMDTVESNHWTSTGLPFIKLPCIVLRARQAI
jgi:hypothetical protein